jgi:hypothetical protein
LAYGSRHRFDSSCLGNCFTKSMVGINVLIWWNKLYQFNKGCILNDNFWISCKLFYTLLFRREYMQKVLCCKSQVVCEHVAIKWAWRSYLRGRPAVDNLILWWRTPLSFRFWFFWMYFNLLKKVNSRLVLKFFLFECVPWF